MHSDLDARAAAWRRLVAGAVLLGAGLAVQAATGVVADGASAPGAAAAAVPAASVPKAKATTLGLYLTAGQAYRKWKADPRGVKIIDVRTPEESFFVGYAPMAWRIPVARVSYVWDAEKKQYPMELLPDFVERVATVAQPDDTLLVMCRSGGRSAIAVNLLAKAGFRRVYNIVDGMEGDTVDDLTSVFHGQRVKNGWKNSGAPWTYKPSPERMVLTTQADVRPAAAPSQQGGKQ
jgi:rhodanese-related sulfurtransferase